MTNARLQNLINIYNTLGEELNAVFPEWWKVERYAVKYIDFIVPLVLGDQYIYRRNDGKVQLHSEIYCASLQGKFDTLKIAAQLQDKTIYQLIKDIEEDANE